jgi:hypothetical protein
MREVKEVQTFIQVFAWLSTAMRIHRNLHILSQNAHPWFNASGGRDHIWPFTTDWGSCVSPLSNFAHSIHLVTSGDVAPRARWCTPPHRLLLRVVNSHMRPTRRLQVQLAGA